MVAGPDASLHEQPANAIEGRSAKARLEADDLDLVEINEAFAAVGLASTRELGIDDDEGQRQRRRDRARPPDRGSGARLALHLALELRRRGGGLGAAALCGGGGQGDALLIKV